MIPIGDDNRSSRTTPFVVFGLIAMNVAAFIYELSLSSSALERFLLSWGLVPYEIFHRQDLSPTIGLPLVATVFSSMFLHGGWLHIAGNMLYLWIFGDNVEDVMGHGRFLLFYLVCGCGAAALQVLIDVDSRVPMIGASGALSGVLAAYLIMFPRRSVRVLVFLGIFVTVISLPALLVIGFWVVLQFLSGAASLGPETAQTDGIAYFAHIGGFLTGALLVLLMRGPRAVARRRTAHYWD